MQSFMSVHSGHDDFIHDLAFDWYGTRMATCSSDQKIKVWEMQEDKWTNTAEIKAHSGSIHRVSWAHPEFGSVLASCSSDRLVYVYEEQLDGRTGQRTWRKQGRLVDSRDSVQDCQFAPRHLGLRLATASLDGRVRIYESNDVMNLSAWSLVEEFEAASSSHQTKCNVACLTWNPSPFDPAMLCVSMASSVKVWEYGAGARRWCTVASLDGHTDEVHDVAWAPNMGRSYHLIATACKDGYVRIYKLHFQRASQTYVPSLVGKVSHGVSGGASIEVWRVCWNVSGSILASSGDDGVSRLWKSDFQGNWQPILVAAATPQQTQTQTRTLQAYGQGNASSMNQPSNSSSCGTAQPSNQHLSSQSFATPSQQTSTRPQVAASSTLFSSHPSFTSPPAPTSTSNPTFATPPTHSPFAPISESKQEDMGISFSAHRTFQ